MPKRKTKLSPRYRLVLDFYYGFSNFNKTDALRRAGYKHPNSQLHIFNHPSVVAAMERREAKVREKYDVTYERITDELARVAYASILNYATITDDGHFLIDEKSIAKASPEELAAIGEVTVDTHNEFLGDTDADGKPVATVVKRIKVKPWNKLAALESLVRHAGLSKEKIQVVGSVSLSARIRAARARVTATADEGEDG